MRGDFESAVGDLDVVVVEVCAGLGEVGECVLARADIGLRGEVGEDEAVGVEEAVARDLGHCLVSVCQLVVDP